VLHNKAEEGRGGDPRGDQAAQVIVTCSTTLVLEGEGTGENGKEGEKGIKIVMSLLPSITLRFGG
jgi:hypothetical protein